MHPERLAEMEFGPEFAGRCNYGFPFPPSRILWSGAWLKEGFLCSGPAEMIQLHKVSKSYDGGSTFAVREVSFSVEKGELLVLLGTSGCGKTTTLKMINRLIERTSGEIRIGGVDVATSSPYALRRSIGYLFQNFGLFPHFTVGENVGVVPKLLGWPRTRIDKRIDELLTLVHLDPGEYRQRYPASLSGGQRQRVAFARALAAGPDLMLLDEPFGALDPITREGLQQEFQQLRRDLGFTGVMVTHDMMEALVLADRIAVMRGGEIVQLAEPRELLSRPAEGYVSELMAGPRRQADVLRTLAGNRPASESSS